MILCSGIDEFTMKYQSATIFLIIFSLCIALSMQYIANEQASTCYSRPCPPGTTSCKKHMKSSFDGRNMEIKVNCLDDFNGSLKEYFIEEINTLNPHTHYESTSYSGTADVIPSFGNYVKHNGIEDFS